VDIAAAYRAALLPGLLLLTALALYVCLRPERSAPSAGGTLGSALRQGIWDWPLIPLVLAGVYGGMVTLAEVAAVVAGYLLVVACLVKREIDPLRQLPAILAESAMLSGAIVVILGFSLALTAYLVEAQVPDRLLAWLGALTDSRWIFLAGLNLLLLLAGCLMDIFSAIVILVPLIAPLANHYGVDPLHLCVIFLLNLEIGYCTPPIGMNLFIAGMQFQRPLPVLYRAALPFLLIMLLVLAAVTYVPALSLWPVR
jgi:tripartite ATP-independent transporter DctM subunit